MIQGSVVIPTAGKEKGDPYAVVSIDADGYALICDGRHRPLERPKRKNPRHLQCTNTVIDEITTNRQLRQFLSAFKSGG